MSRLLFSLSLFVLATVGCHDANERSAAPGVFVPEIQVTEGDANGPLIISGAYNDQGQSTIIDENQGPDATALGGRAFGNRVVNTMSPATTITVTNVGTGTLGSIAVSLSFGDTADFSVDTTGLLGSLEPGASTSFSVRFTPMTTGAKNARVAISHNVGSVFSPILIPVTGTGLPNNP